MGISQQTMVGIAGLRRHVAAGGWFILLSAQMTMVACSAANAQTPAVAAAASESPSGAATAQPQRLDINEYRITGTKILKPIEIEEAVYPFLGPNRTVEDVEGARAALEKAYNAKGYQTVSVQVPPQRAEGGVVTLNVVEGEIGRLRVRGSRYFSLDSIKQDAPSLAEGKVPNFNEISQDIVALNQLPDRRVTPTLRAGKAPGTVDVDLNVEDKFPLHGTLELNNRYSANTTSLRLNGTLRYDNLWQLGHSVSASFQVAPENPDDAKVFSGSYLARLSDPKWLSLLLYGVKSDSNVSTLGGVNVVGRGEVVGIRSIISLPSDEDFVHTLSAGIDYKHFTEDITLGGDVLPTPITYYPITAMYTAIWSGTDGNQTELNAGVTFHIRGMDNGFSELDNKRTFAGGNFIYFRGDLAHTHELPEGLQGYGKISGQIADQALVSNEQFSAGGLETVRGYLESEVLGDNGLTGTIELRSPSLTTWFGPKSGDDVVDEWRVHVFADGGIVTVNNPTSEQESSFNLASVGVGTRIKLLENFQGTLDVGLPLIDQATTRAFDPQVQFRLWAEY